MAIARYQHGHIRRVARSGGFAWKYQHWQTDPGSVFKDASSRGVGVVSLQPAANVQTVLEWTEPALVVSPLEEPLTEYRPAYLF